MDTSAIYSKTGKGLMAAKTDAGQLTPLQAQLLALVDGQASVAQLAAMLDAAQAGALPQALAQLESLELIHVYRLAEAARDVSAVAAIEVMELSPTDSVQAWAEAQRGARELAEKGFYSPPVHLHHAAHQAGADVNRVLVVEDEATTALVLEFLLKEHDFQVVTAVDGAAALAELERHPLPDVVLLDVMLPDSDGFAILQHIRSTPHLSQLPVIMVTAKISDDHVLRGLKEGADGYVFKPFKWETLYACIKNVL